MNPRELLILVVLMLPALAGCSDSRPGTGGGHGVVLLYHHVSEDTPASTSVTPEQFERHLEYLEDHGFEVWALDRLLDALFQGEETVPDNVVAITFDDAYESVLGEAHPRLARRGWPYTVFVNTEAVDAGYRPYLDWDSLRELAGAGAAVENHSASHGHLIAREAGESERAWRERVAADVKQAHSRIAEEIGRPPRLFAYPFGEDSPALARIVATDHDYALVQRSGAVGPDTDPMAVPRFPMASGFDSMKRFAMAVDARPLPVLQARPEPPGEGVRAAVEALILDLAEAGYRKGALSCFSGGGQALNVEESGSSKVRVAHDRSGSPGRNRINCTAPAADGSGAWYWYSYQWVQDEVRD